MFDLSSLILSNRDEISRIFVRKRMRSNVVSFDFGHNRSQRLPTTK